MGYLQTMLSSSQVLDDTPVTGRFALAVSYNGGAYRGWQSQGDKAVPTVQGSLQDALSYVANRDVVVQCAGRTDAGVHASFQLVHFDCTNPRSEKAWVRGGNCRLPDDIAIHWARAVGSHFDARRSAIARRYRYLILNSATRSALMPNGVTWCNQHLDEERMHEAAQALLGERDFSSFRAAGCQSNTPMRNVHFVTVSRRGELVVIDIQANAFLYHMVRNIAGALMAVGTGRRPVSWISELMEVRNRCASAPTAKAGGLYLVSVSYPARFGLPKVNPGPYFLPVELHNKRDG